ncbi:predicted protein [Lichtheimia corymbifera JMRC:FSU:9682]|uniref:Uncharacterized protein n=1 Tax=Lichtheimia corymbifera JMRC:FSU:9682 TaxID=1263082 RepID=A0A068SCQ0_9FUNG|nr:predicted protein [Lichtheimia corymbifera JMRC:FSU:9682]CDH59612.1 predicted protein [Lichtheimia corymbifera JMRC:FSU:9682]
MFEKKLYHDSGIDDVTAMPDDVYYSDITLDQSSQDDDSDLDELVANEKSLPSRSSFNRRQRKQRRERTTSSTFLPSTSTGKPECHLQPYYGSVRMSPDDVYRQQEAMDSSRPFFISRALPPPPPPSLPCTVTQRCTATSFASTKPMIPAKGILKKRAPESLLSSNQQAQEQQQLHAASDGYPSTTKDDGDHGDALLSRGVGGSTMRRLKNKIRHYILAHGKNNNSRPSPPPCESCPSTTSAISVVSANSTNRQQVDFQKKKVRYNKMVLVQDTYASYEYDRSPDPQSSCMRLTPEYVDEIKNEVNLFKFDEMVVHPCSRIYTHFYSV